MKNHRKIRQGADKIIQGKIMKKFDFHGAEFIAQNKTIRLMKLFGMDMEPEEWVHERSVGIFNVFASLSCYRPQLIRAVAEKNTFRAIFEADKKLRYVSLWELDRELKLVVRQDYVENISQDDILLNRACMHFVLRNDRLQSFYQNNVSCQENIGTWKDIEHGGFFLSCEEGKITGGATPFLALKNVRGEGLVFHLEPNGNWQIRLKTQAFGFGNGGKSHVELELGQREQQFAMRLKPGEKFFLPKLIVQDLCGGLCNSTPNLHRYFLKNCGSRKEMPIGYNTWYDIYDTMVASRLQENLQTAKELGLEQFTIDAGWFGGSIKEREWYDQVGDWTEKGSESFGMTLQEFSRKVRESGLKFGLWLEPERVSELSPVYRENPEYFTPGDNGAYPEIFYKWKIYEQEPYDRVKQLICGLIETYHLSWLLLDFNFELYYDETFSESYRYYRAWNRLIAEVREKYPETVIEGCAAGGMRLDLSSANSFDCLYLNDNVNPWDSFAAYVQGTLRLPPFKIDRWCCIKRGADEEFGTGKDVGRRETVAVTSGSGAGWGQAERVSVNFACALALHPIMSFSGDLRRLSSAQKEIVKKYVAFQKEYRKIYDGSILFYESDNFLKSGNREGTVFLQYCNEERDISLVHAYRFMDCGGRTFVLKNLKRIKRYRVFDPIYKKEWGIFSGKELMEKGIKLDLIGDHSARILCVERA